MLANNRFLGPEIVEVLEHNHASGNTYLPDSSALTSLVTASMSCEGRKLFTSAHRGARAMH